ncbi:MAG: hypothetical protein ACW7DZ_16830 [Paraglaciecola chathamensis]
MHDIEQQVLEKVKTWAGSKAAAKEWYEKKTIPALGSTAKAAVRDGNHQAVLAYLESMALGGYA